MLQSTPNAWYNIDELYTISSQGTIELNTFENKDRDRMSATTSPETYHRSLCNRDRATAHNTNTQERTFWQKVITSSKIDFLRHVFDTQRPIQERIIWSIIIIILSMCAIIIGICVVRSTSRPILTEGYIPVSQLYFPAVTICPENKIYKQTSRQNSRLTNFSDFEDTNKFEESELRRMLCDSLPDMDEVSTSPPQQRASRAAKDNIMTRALRLSPQLTNFMHSCKFGVEDCFNGFEKAVTEEGLCYTFNGFNLQDIYSPNLVLPLHEDTIQSDDGEKPFRYMTAGASLPFSTSFVRSSGPGPNQQPQLISNPRRAANHLQHLTLELFTINEYADDSCRANAGFKIMIHDPETPAHSAIATVIDVAMDSEVSVTVLPTLFSTTNAARSDNAYHCHQWRNGNLDHSPNQNLNSNQTYSEPTLRLFQFYSKANCQYESIAQFLEQCAGCVPFYMPHKTGSLSCNSTNLSHLQQCFEQLSTGDVFKDCIPGCEHVAYSISNSRKYYRWTVNHKFRKYTAMSRVRIRFQDYHAILKQWKEDSLFMETCAIVLFVLVVICVYFGISVISMAELIYSSLAFLCRRKEGANSNVLSKHSSEKNDQKSDFSKILDLADLEESLKGEMSDEIRIRNYQEGESVTVLY